MKESIQQRFIKELYNIYPKQSELVKSLTDLLDMERTTLYRRLRKQITFSAEEIFKIAAAWNISLDDIANVISKEHLFKARLVNYINPPAHELQYIQDIMDALYKTKSSYKAEYIEVCNTLPDTFIINFPMLAQYKLLAWAYYYDNKNRTHTFSNIKAHDTIIKTMPEIIKEIKNIKTTTYILDPFIIKNAVDRVSFFHSIHIISDEEKISIKNNLIELLDYIYKIASTGIWPETSKKVKIYIAHTNIDTHYSYLHSDKYNVCTIHAFSYHRLYTRDTLMLENIRTWIQLYKEASFLISATDEKSRIDFFDKQHAIVQTL